MGGMTTAIRQSLLSEPSLGGQVLVGWSLDQYHELIKTGGIPEDSRVELIDGLLIWKDRAKLGGEFMTIGDRHRMTTLRLSQLASHFSGEGCYLQTQLPIAIPPNHEPEPDASIIRGRIDDYVDRVPGPGDTIAVIEVSDSSLHRDLFVKLPIYATSGIPQYIVINLQDDVALLFSEPGVGTYHRKSVLERDAMLELPTGTARRVQIALATLLG
jgi:Uma2 family endonuclease